MHLETHARCWEDDHNSTSYSECGGPENEEKHQIPNQNLHKIISLNQNSNPEKIHCKIPIIFEKELLQPYNYNPDLTFLEIIIKGLKNQRAHCINDLDDFSKNLVLDWTEAFLKARMQPKFPIELKPASMVTIPNKRQESQIAAYSKKNSSTSSYPSSSSTNSTSFCTSTDIGLLRRVWHNGLPHFQFSTDGPDRVFVANPTKVKSEKDLALDYIYLFHEVGNTKKESTSRFLGNMRVSSSFVLNPNGSNCIETEFVLFGSKEDYDQEMQNPCSSLVKNKGLIRKVAEMLKPSSPLPRYTHKSSKSILCKTSTIEGDIIGNKQSGSTCSITCENFPTNHELATIIVRDSENSAVKKEPVIGGWGLKILQKIETRKNSSSRRKINVLVPKGFHGGPAGPNAGPASLRERWSSGGCDCGGWDAGCPITVFSNGNESGASPHGESHESGPDNLFIEVSVQTFSRPNSVLQGIRHDEPVLKLVVVGENAFMVYFPSNLSMLQCFSIAVAMVHAQTPDLYPKL
ncbi:hypothetical protein FCM35_KLT06709 [Carex littledalei]|uniref:Uncharacterized protein n=1 Tax=Carex littledalei TaxID=544730 RepID=A0A833R0L1_9POAL|nr:hypothetical protein FCM35_KLT06709 [Carex littledalei]